MISMPLEKGIVLKVQIVCIFIACVLPAVQGLSQTSACESTLSGTVMSSADGKPVFAATILLDSTGNGAVSDTAGYFIIRKVCPDTYHIIVRSIGFVTKDTLLRVNGSRNIRIVLVPDMTMLQEVNIRGSAINPAQVQTVTTDAISGAQLQQTRGETLGDALKGMTGVSVLRSGPTIAKPVIHGLYSNRVLILNNGVRQEGQQWGSDHAPEIDPFIATKLSVIKGAASIRYGSDAIGGVVLVEPPPLPSGKSLGGEVNLVGMDNSRMYCGSGIVQGSFDKHLSGLSFRLQGTYRRAGNLQAPHYYLDNTGLLEKNYTAALGYEKKKFGADIYFSKFYTQIGIYTGSHVGNPTELLQTFSGEKPIEQYGFSYTIKRGYQLVDHYLLKASSYYISTHAGKLEAVYALQKDVRQEFDFDVPYSSNGVDLSHLPQVYFQLITNTDELIWEHTPWHGITGSAGLNFITQGNVFKGLTYRSVIPNFRNYGGGAFLIEKWSQNRLTLEAGIRYDYKWQREYMLDNNTLELNTPTQSYRNFTSTFGLLEQFTPRLSFNANFGNGWRAPSV